MGTLLGKTKQEGAETPGKDSILKRIEDPRSPGTEEISRTPIEVEDKVPKSNLRNLAYSNALKQYNQNISEDSPRCRIPENGTKDIKKPKYSFSEALENTPILYAEESNLSLDVSAIEKENVQ